MNRAGDWVRIGGAGAKGIDGEIDDGEVEKKPEIEIPRPAPAWMGAAPDPMRRRLLQGALCGWAGLLAGGSLPQPAVANASANLPPGPGLQRWGHGEFRRFGFLVYAASLWAGEDPLRPPLALRLDYQRRIAGSAIADASVKEMRPLGADESSLRAWGEQMTRLFPDVQAGDHIVGHYLPDRARFVFNGRMLGEIVGADFARLFFGIWLDPRTSAPELRAALLRKAST